MKFAPRTFYPDSPYELIIFDVRIPGIAERFGRERAAWAEHRDVEMLDLNHPVLIARPSLAREGQ